MKNKTMTFQYDSELYWFYKNALNKSKITQKEAGVRFIKSLIEDNEDLDLAKESAFCSKNTIKWNEFKRKSGIDNA